MKLQNKSICVKEFVHLASDQCDVKRKGKVFWVGPKLDPKAKSYLYTSDIWFIIKTSYAKITGNILFCSEDMKHLFFYLN